MKIKYTATTSISIYYKIQCEGCNQIFDGVFQLEGKSSQSLGLLNLNAEENALNQSQSILQHRIEEINQGDYTLLEDKRCPHCGYLQSYMVKARRQAFGTFPLVLSVVVGFLYFWLAYGIGGEPPDTIFQILAYPVIAFPSWFILMIVFGVGLYNLLVHPNREWFKKRGKTTGQAPSARAPLEIRVR